MADVFTEPQEVHTDENGALPVAEKKQKRIVKTPAQVAALENFYNDHKYPTEAMKIELAESIGLTEKQVSGWFCHRRLKDKKSPNDDLQQAHGKQDRSSGVIQDRGSGLRQDSCGSTKQAGDNKHSDLKEVESRRFTTAQGQGLLHNQVRFSQHNSLAMDEDDDDDDDTSSGSSSPLKPQNMALTYPTHSNDLKSVKGPSGYLKVKGQVENAAITAVKRQLGRHYREDGPPLGIEFESLPPGAFENNLVKIPVNQSYYVGDRTALPLHSIDGSRTFQPPNASKMYERYNPKSYHHHAMMDDYDESGLEMRHASNKHREYNNNKQPLPLAISKHHHRHALSGRSLQMEVNDEFSGGEEHLETRTKHVSGVRRPDSVSNRHPIPYAKHIEENYGPTNTNVIYRERKQPVTSVKRGEFDESGLSRKMLLKAENFDGERRGIDEYSIKQVSAKIHPGNEMRVIKRSRDEFEHHGYPRKEAMVDVPLRTTKVNRSIAMMSSSNSDDGTAETTSSGN